MPLDLEKKFGSEIFLYAPELEFFFKSFFTMLLDLEFILEQKIFHHASGLRKFFELNFFPLCSWTWKNFFWKWKFFTITLDLENFLKVFFHYAPRLNSPCLSPDAMVRDEIRLLVSIKCILQSNHELLYRSYLVGNIRPSAMC